MFLSKKISIITVIITLCILFASPLFADTLYLKDGRVLKGKVEKTENNIIYFKTALGVEKISKEDIWKLVDDEGNILYENPANKPGKVQEKPIEKIAPAEKVKLHLNDGRILEGTIIKTEEDIIHIKTALFTEEVKKSIIWKMIDSKGEVLYENPANEPEKEKQVEQKPVQQKPVERKIEEPPKVKQEQPQTAKKEEPPIKFLANLWVGLYSLGTDFSYKQSENLENFEGTMGISFGLDIAYFFKSFGELGSLGATLGAEQFAPKLTVKDTEVSADFTYKYSKLGLCWNKGGVVIALGYVSVEASADIPIVGSMSGTNNGFFGDFRFYFQITKNLLGYFGYGQNIAGKKNVAGGLKLNAGIGVAF